MNPFKTFSLLLIAALCVLSPFTTIAQEDSTVVQDLPPQTEYITKAFFGNRVLNGHSIETTGKGKLDLVLEHRMGRLDQGFSQFFGLDQASFSFGFEYGITDWLMAGVGRSTYNKQYDGFIKARILRQSKGKVNMPLSVVAVAGMGLNSTPWADPDRENHFSSRLSYTWQVIIGRRLWDRVGVQVAPTLIHRNLVNTAADHNDVFALGLGGRFRFSRRVAFNIEYFYVFPNQIVSQYNGSDVTNNLSAGVEIFTGKHVFQIFLTNGSGMAENQIITQNTESWFNGVHIGFNMTRLFTVAEY